MASKERLLWESEKPEPRTLRIELPFVLPTWNRILGLQEFQRMKLRHLLHLFSWYSITYGTDLPTEMESQGKRCSTLLCRLEYLQMIRPRKSRTSVISNLKSAAKKKKKRS